MDLLLKNLELEEKNLILNNSIPESPPSNRYNSVFTINGRRILPPLMTREKRKEMQALKEQAIEVERRMQLKKKEQEEEPSNEGGRKSWRPILMRERGGGCCSSRISSTRLQSSISDDKDLKEEEEEKSSKKNFPEDKKHVDLKALRRTALILEKNAYLAKTTTTTTYQNQNEPKKSHKKLILPLESDTDEEEALHHSATTNRSSAKATNRDVLSSREQLEELERTANLNYVQRAPPMFKTICGNESTTSGDGNNEASGGGIKIRKHYEYKTLPAININPPTPQTEEESDFHSISVGDYPLPDSDSSESLIISDVPPDSFRFFGGATNQQMHVTRYNNLDARSSSALIHPEEDNCCVKVQNVLNDENDVLCNGYGIVEDELMDLNHPVVETNHPSSLVSDCSQMNRSATSPSIHRIQNHHLHRNHPGKKDSSPTRENNNNNSNSNSNNIDNQNPGSNSSSTTTTKHLIRSNSFVLDCPSKALIEHMRQQNAARYSNLNLGESTNNSNKSNNNNHVNQKISNCQNLNASKSSLRRLTRDTVESKAKKVQKPSPTTTTTPSKQQNRSTTGSQQGHGHGQGQGQGHHNNSSSLRSTTGNSSQSISISVSANHVSYANKRSPYDPIKSSNPSARERCVSKTTIGNRSASTVTPSTPATARSKLPPAQKSLHSIQHRDRDRDQHNGGGGGGESSSTKPLKSAHHHTKVFGGCGAAASSKQQQRNSGTTEANNYSDGGECGGEARVLEELNEKHRLSLMNLLARQENERQKLQEMFEEQQEQLVAQLNKEVTQHIQTQQKEKHFQQQQQQQKKNAATTISNLLGNRNPHTHNSSQSLCRINNSLRNKGSSSSSSGNVSRSSPTTCSGAQTARNLGHHHHHHLNSSSSTPGHHRSGTTGSNGRSTSTSTVLRTTISTTNSTKVVNFTTTTPRRHLYMSECGGVLAGGEEEVATTTSGGGTSLHSSPEQTRIPAPMYSRTSSYSNSDAAHNSSAGASSSSEQELEIGEHLVEEAVNECRRTMAANTINAFVRGYLVRRLLRTEYVRSIVQTIHDTLIFLEKLHQETQDDPRESEDPANRQLQKQLFQQLSTSSRSFYNTFFEIPLKQRLQLIERDRHRILNKKKLNIFQGVRRKLYN